MGYFNHLNPYGGIIWTESLYMKLGVGEFFGWRARSTKRITTLCGVDAIHQTNGNPALIDITFYGELPAFHR